MMSKILHHSAFQWIFFLGIALFSIGIIAIGGLKLGIMAVAGILGIAALCASLNNLKIGVIVIIFLGFFLNVIKIYTLTEVPIGIAIDALLILLFIGAYIQSSKERKPIVSKGFFNTVLLVFFAYQFLEVLNPLAYSKTAWLFAFRQMFSIYMIYFVFSYAIKDLKFITTIIKLWIGLCLLAAIYGLIQEFFGFRDFEKAWLAANPEVAVRYFTFGKWRRFSFFTGPMDFGIMMAFTSIMCIALAFGPFQIWKKLTLTAFALLMLWAMMYTGTRTAFILLPAGFIFYAVLTFKRNILIALSVFLIMGTVVIMRPATNQTVFVIQTAFMGKKDASYMVREKNKAFIQPFIWSHPIGGGIGSCGMVGKRYAPGSILAGFPPDSEFVKVAVEQGWIGLAIFCLLFASAMHLGIKNYFYTQNQQIKTYYAAILSGLFMVIVASYPQEALQLTINIFVGTALALVVKMKLMDDLITQ